MAFDWKKLINLGVGVASVTLPGGEVKDNVLDNVTAILDDDVAPNTDATKLLAATVDSLAKEVKKLRAEVDAFKKAKK